MYIFRILIAGKNTIAYSTYAVLNICILSLNYQFKKFLKSSFLGLLQTLNIIAVKFSNN